MEPLTIMAALTALIVIAPSRGPRTRRNQVEDSRSRYPYPAPVLAVGTGERNNRSGYVRPMGERWAGRTLRSLIDWMDVEASVRWSPRHRGLADDGTDRGNATYCDHYAFDFLDQWWGPNVVPFPAGVWWSRDAEARLQRGERVIEDLLGDDRNLYEKNATGTNEWLRTKSQLFGWRRYATAAELQQAVNRSGYPGIISTPRHVAVLVPDSMAPDFAGSGPLLTQAGGRNRKFDRGNSWYRSNADVYFGMWTPN